MISTMTTKSIVSLKGVSKCYAQPTGQQIHVLEKIDLALYAGEVVALLGPSGSGKSTLMRMIAGLVAATDGQIWYHNQPMVGLNPGVAIVFQNAALYPWLTVLENVELGLKAKGIAPALRHQQALAMIDVIGLDGFENAYPKELSGGMRQRVGFARALAVAPELLCLDEPFSALDVLTAENLRKELMDLWLDRHIPIQTILLVTHSIEEAVMLADRMVILGRNPGRIRAELRVNLRHNRDRKSPEFQALMDEVYKVMTQPDLEQVEPRSPAIPFPQKYQQLPHVRVGSIAGLLELLEHRPDEDLYRLEQELQLEANDILPIIEAAKLIGLIELRSGDIHLTATTNQFIQSNIDERKQIIRKLLLANVQLVQKIDHLLKVTTSQRIPKELLLDILTNHFSPKEAERQLDTAIAWGRYAELFGFDEPRSEIFGPEEDSIAAS